MNGEDARRRNKGSFSKGRSRSFQSIFFPSLIQFSYEKVFRWVDVYGLVTQRGLVGWLCVLWMGLSSVAVTTGVRGEVSLLKELIGSQQLQDTNLLRNKSILRIPESFQTPLLLIIQELSRRQPPGYGHEKLPNPIWKEPTRSSTVVLIRWGAVMYWRC